MQSYKEQVEHRHNQVRDITQRHLDAMRKEILETDPLTLNLDNAGDAALLIKVVADQLVEQLRGFAAGSRRNIAAAAADSGEDINQGDDPRRWA